MSNIDEDENLNIDLASVNWLGSKQRQGGRVGFSGGEVTMGSNRSYGDVSSSVGDCTSSTNKNATDHYEFDDSNEADSTVAPVLRNIAKTNAQRRITSVTTSDNERPSSSGITNGTTSYLHNKNLGKDLYCENVMPTILSVKSTPSAAAGSVYGGDATYMHSFNKGPSASSSVAFHNTETSLWPSTTTMSTTHQTDADQCRPPGDVGLINSGNTCFMNSGLQCMLHTPSLVQYFLRLDLHQYASANPVVKEFQNLMKYVWFGISSPLYITNFRHELAERHPHFKDGRQHDCQEFLAQMLDTLHEQLKEMTKETVKSPRLLNGQKRNGIGLVEDNHARKRSKLASSATSENDIEDGSGDAPGSPVENGLMNERSKAEEHWNDYLAKNNTVIASTFHGLFKSTVVCEVCACVSVTYEPFMYLAVPIPRVSNRKLYVSFVGWKDSSPVDVCVTLSTDDTVGKLKELVVTELGRINDPPCVDNLIVAEVVNYNIARRLNEEMQISNINDGTRKIYIYELNVNFMEKYGSFTNLSTLHGIYSYNNFQPPILVSNTCSSTAVVDDENWDDPDTSNQLPPLIPTEALPEIPTEGKEGEDGMEATEELRTESESLTNEPKETCIICLEEQPVPLLLKHKVCGAILCTECLQRAATFLATGEVDEKNNTPVNISSEKLKCPMCLTDVNAIEFVNFTSEPSTQCNLVGILFRLPLDSNNNSTKNSGRLFGAPRITRIPSSVPAQELRSFLDSINPFPNLSVKYVRVLCNGLNCAKCYPTDNCDGCELPTEGDVSIPSGTAIGISFNEITREQIAAFEHGSMPFVQTSNVSFKTNEPIIDIHDCLRSFSEVEHLDEQNPWHCPKCDKNQKAMKTMSIAKFPDCLIINVKRFVFMDNSSTKLSNKLRFPLEDLDMNAYSSPESAGRSKISYDLYSCVCHFGTVNAGHYTTYSKNPVTNAWNYFNDSMVSAKQPGEDEFASAYVLFYNRKDLNYDIPKRTEETIMRNPPVCIPRISATAIVAPSTSVSPETWVNPLGPCGPPDSSVATTVDVTSLDSELQLGQSSGPSSSLNNFSHPHMDVSSSEISNFVEDGGIDIHNPYENDCGNSTLSTSHDHDSSGVFSEEENGVSTSEPASWQTMD